MLPRFHFTLHLCKLHNILYILCRKMNWWMIFYDLIFRVTFRRVIRKKSTEEFSCIPYMIGLLNCLLFTWYGLPIVSYKWENFPVVTVNGVGIVLEFCYVVIYFWYSSPKTKVKVAMITTFVLAVFGVTAAVSAFALHDSPHRKLLVGSVGLCVSVALYGSPLVAMVR